MAILGIRGRRVGAVSAVHEHCFEVKRQPEEGGPICLKAEALFTVDKKSGITLICAKEDVERYRCPDHTDEKART